MRRAAPGRSPFLVLLSRADPARETLAFLAFILPQPLNFVNRDGKNISKTGEIYQGQCQL